MPPRHALPFLFAGRLIEKTADRCVVMTPVGSAQMPRAGEPGGSGDLPLTLVIEMMVQAAMPLLAEGAAGALVGFDAVRQERPVRPGDRLRITSEIIARLGDLIRFRSLAEIDGERSVEAEFTVAGGARHDGPS